MTAGRAAVAFGVAAVLLCAACTLPARSSQLPAVAGAAGDTAHSLQPVTRSGREIYAEFRSGLSDQQCANDTSERWRRHFSHVPQDLAERPERLLPLFGYVVDALREYHLPTEYALIPFVESGYRPGARSPSGPAGLWQFITVTARNHEIAIRPGYDGRLSPVESTTAAVRYLRTLHGMFAGDWRLAVMGYNAGEYRIFGALRSAGQRAMDAEPEKLAVPGITRAYVRKLQALSCLLVEAGQDEQWLDSIDRAVPLLTARPLPADVRQLDRWAGRNGHDPALVRHFNPVFPDGRVARADRGLQVLVPARPRDALVTLLTQPGGEGPPVVFLADASHLVEQAGTVDADAAPRTHTVARGESIWRIARRYGLGTAQLLLRNGLSADSVLHPGTVLQIDAADPGGAPPVAN
ncbi:MAG: transglycosylase SLT domain-containing protein [Luteimonas sp.]